MTFGSETAAYAGAKKTFAIYAGAVICFGGLIFAGIRMMSGRFADAIPGLFGALSVQACWDGAPAGLGGARRPAGTGALGLFQRGIQQRGKTGADSAARRNLQFWIESNVLLVLKDALSTSVMRSLFPRRAVAPTAPNAPGTTNSCSLTTSAGRATGVDPKCYQAKLAAHVAKTVAAKPELVQISTAYGTQKEGSPVLPRNKYTAVREDKPKSNDEAKRPEFKVCKFTTDAIVTEGSDSGTIYKVCNNPDCPIHHPKKVNGNGRERCCIQSRAGKAAQGGSHRQCNRLARSLCD